MDTWHYGKTNFEGNKPHKLFQQEKYCPVNILIIYKIMERQITTVIQ